jgi:uncharacterized protein
VYDREVIESILDEGFVCHLAAVVDGAPVVLPTAYARADGTLYLHGAQANRLLGEAGDGVDVCVAVTLVDGLVLARSAFHHSMNYRSVVVHGRATRVTDPSAKRAAMDALVDHVAPGRSGGTRAPSDGELRATLVLALPLDEASAKVRTGPPIDDDEDYGLDLWAGVLPLRLAVGPPEPDPALPPDVDVPDHVSGWRRPRP